MNNKLNIKKPKRKIICLSMALLLNTLVLPTAVFAEASAGDDPNAQTPAHATNQVLTSGSTVLNPDGSYTFTQIVDENSGTPYYVPPANGGGFEIYSDAYQDYGWMHDFPAYNTPGISIKSAQVKVRAWDVDSETYHGYSGEYDGLSVDGAMLDPGYLQGNDNQWSETTFDVLVTNIIDDGKMNMWLDIDMHQWGWLTTLDYSQLTITYTIGNSGNLAPYKPVLQAGGQVNDSSDILATVLGPNPADPDGDTVTYSYRWFVDVGNGFFVDDEFAGRGNHTGNIVPAADTQVGDKWKVQVTPTDEHGAIGPYENAIWEVTTSNQPPVIVSDTQSVTVDEGSVANNTGTWSDPDKNDVTLTASVGTVTKGAGTWTWSYQSVDGASPDTQNVTITADDGNGGTSKTTFALNVTNVAPTVGTINVSSNLVPIGTSVTAKAAYTDPSPVDTHTAEWIWEDGSSNTPGDVDSTSRTVSGSHTYNTSGVYTIALNVKDDDGGVGTNSYQYVVVYDPSAGFVTGGGWIDSPEGAYVGDPSLSGKASFGFVSKYVKGSTVPTGSTEFQFQVANLNFHSSSYEWLVVSGSKAQYKGTGTINGQGNYGFMLTAIDGSLDKFRIKIWNKDTDTFIYDNQLSASNDADPTTALSSGSIVIHKAK